MNLNKKEGFTLLEIIIVIIIVGVLASLALPRLFKTVEFSRSGEALASFSSIRSAMERCYLQRGGNYTACTTFSSALDVEDPALSPNAHFTYAISSSATTYAITATRNTVDGGNSGDVIQLFQSTTGVSKSGGGAFSGIN